MEIKKGTEHGQSRMVHLFSLRSWLWCFKFLLFHFPSNEPWPGLGSQVDPFFPILLFIRVFFLSEQQKWNLNKAPTCSGNGSIAYHPHSSIPVWFSHYVTYISNHVTFSATRERFQHPGTLASLSTLPLKVANCISPPLYGIRKPHLGQCLASSTAPSTWPVLKSPVWLVIPFFG